MDDIVEYIATAHHRPSSARRAFNRWVNNDLKTAYRQSCDKRIVAYAQKTGFNLSALMQQNNYLASPQKEATMVASQKYTLQESKDKGPFSLVEVQREDGRSVYKYVVEKGKNPAQIVRDFETIVNREGRYASMTENLFSDKTYQNVVSSPVSSRYVGDNIRAGLEVFVLAKPI